MKHAFITFEGGEGAGKTTLIEAIHEELLKRSFQVLKTRAPGGTAAGKEIRELLLHKGEISSRCELFLFLADRAEHVEKVIHPALLQHKIVLCDRFNDSTIAYQGAARGFNEEKVKELCHFASSGLEPTLTIYLDIDPKLGFQRLERHKDKIEAENLLFHQKIREAFQRIAHKEPQRFHLLDASQTPDQVFRQALELILREF